MAAYVINEVELDTVYETKYLGVVIQNDLKFNTHIRQKVGKAKGQLGMTKQALHCASQSAKTLAYTSLSPTC